jgi:hypothetical protein
MVHFYGELKSFSLVRKVDKETGADESYVRVLLEADASVDLNALKNLREALLVVELTQVQGKFTEAEEQSDEKSAGEQIVDAVMAGADKDGHHPALGPNARVSRGGKASLNVENALHAGV